MAQQRVIVDVDARGRMSVARFGLKSTQLVVDALPGGGLVMHEAVALTPAEVAHFRSPAAIAQLEHGMADAQAGRVRQIELRSERMDASDKQVGVVASGRKTAKFTREGIQSLANDKPVVYKIKNSKGRNLYIGSAKKGRVRQRLEEHLSKGKDAVPGANSVQIAQKSSLAEAHRSEQRIIKRSKPTYNKQGL